AIPFFFWRICKYLHHYYITIFSIGITSIPCAPLALSFSITSQNSSSTTTECILLQPLSASGNMVGLFIPGIRDTILSRFLLGAFKRIYLFFLAFFTACILNISLSTIAFSALLNDGLPISTASLFITISTSLRPLLNKVLPELTKSHIASARPIPGAISTEPLISCISAFTLFFLRKSVRIFV